MPQPDFAVFRFREDFYLGGARPRPEDTLLVVEVADTSLRYDETAKLALYARAAIPEFWIVDVAGRTVRVHRRPRGDTYAEASVHQLGEAVALLAEPNIRITLERMFA